MGEKKTTRCRICGLPFPDEPFSEGFICGSCRLHGNGYLEPETRSVEKSVRQVTAELRATEAAIPLRHEILRDLKELGGSGRRSLVREIEPDE